MRFYITILSCLTALSAFAENWPVDYINEGIDLGGGFASANRLKPEYDLPGSDIMGMGMLAPYAAAILSRLDKAREVFGGRPTLVLEPGRAVVDSAVQLLCTVIAAKDIPGRGRMPVTIHNGLQFFLGNRLLLERPD